MSLGYAMTETEWFYLKDGVQYGPIDEVRLQHLATSGQLMREDEVWHDGMPEWVAAQHIPDLFDEVAEESPEKKSSSLGLILGLSGVGMVGLIAIIIVAVMSASGGARDQAGYMKWQSHLKTLKDENALVIFYSLEDNEGAKGDVKNQTLIDPKSKFEPADFDGNFPGSLDEQPSWGTGRWTQKLGLNFDGKNDFFVVPHHKQFRLAMESISLTMWIKQKQPHKGCVISKSHSELTGYEVRVSNDNVVHLRVGDKNVKSPPELADGDWHFVVAVIDAEQGKFMIYVDGTKWETGDFASDIATSPAPLYIGRSGAADGVYFHGTICELGIYKRALSTSEIDNMYIDGRL